MRIFEKVFTISLALLKSKAGKKLVAAWGISMLLFSASPAQAAEWRVSYYEEFKLALQYTVKNGDTIILEDNIVFDANSTALVLPAGITEITVKSVGGYMYEIKGKADRLLMTENKTNVTLILENVTFTGGSLTGEDNNGAAIFSGGNLIIKGTEENPVVFSQNLSESSGGAISADGTVTIESGSNQFTANVANGGGAVHSQGNMVITGGINTFDTNFGLLVGGAIVTGAISEDALADILKVDENGKLTYSVPPQFQTGGNGPKVILSGGENWFDGNFAAYAGGAIFSDVDISGGKNYFHENYAALAGGAIVGGKINITGGTNEFIGNGKTPDPNEFDNSAAGGAIFAFDNMVITGGKNIFEENASYQQGGAIAAQKFIILDGENTFKNNESWLGGAIYAGREGDDGLIGGYVAISGGTNVFEGNTGSAIYAANGDEEGDIGRVAISGGTNSFIENINENNAQGGAIHSEGDVMIDGDGINTFADNAAAGGTAKGGAVYAGEDVLISGGETTFDRNYAFAASDDGRAEGGAVYAQQDVKISGGLNSFAGNGAIVTNEAGEADGEAYGGAVFAFEDVLISGGKNTFEGNSAIVKNKAGEVYGEAYGGAIFAHEDAIISGGVNTFEANWVEAEYAEGGAVYAVDKVEISGGTNTFTGNYAQGSYWAYGGAISAYSEGVAITGGSNRFEGNYAQGGEVAGGGAISADKNIEISGGVNVFADNWAKSDVTAEGGAIHSLKGIIIAGVENTFADNVAIGNTEASGGAIFAHEDVIISKGENIFEDNWAVTTNIDGAAAPAAAPLAPWPVATAKGGAIYADKNVILDDITIFKNNTAWAEGDEDASGGTYGPVASGGAIYANEKVISEGVTTFEDNWAIGGQIAEGGAIYARDNVELLNSVNTFTGNWAVATGNGAAVLPLYAAEGGAIFSHGDVIISNSQNTFTDNGAGATDRTDLTSTATGGAIYTPNSVKITASDNLFKNNFAISNNFSYGGAIYASVDVTITDSTNTFEGNMAFVDSDGVVTDDGVSAVAPEARGGAIFAYKNMEISGGANVFKNNHALGGDGGFGGAIAGAVAGVVDGENHIITIRGGTNGFEGNSAFGYHTASGGAIFSLTDVEISDGLNVFLNNWAEGGVAAGGGAIYAETDTAIQNSTVGFTGNSATGGEFAAGGAINAQNVMLENSFSLFENNWVEGGYGAYGGAIYAEGDVIITGGETMFYNNIADGAESKGGAIYAEGDVTFTGGSQVTFLSNDAADGSALYAEGTFTLEEGSTLTGEGEFAAAEFSLSDSCLTPSGEMIFKGNSGTPTTITLENMALLGSYDGYLAAGDGDILKIDGDFNVDVEENVTIGLGGRVEADAGSKLVKDGAGDLRIIGEQHYYNAEVSDGGFMLGQVDGEDGMLIGHLSVFDSGKLGGNGKIIGNVTMNDVSILAPGNSIGTIAIEGDLSMDGTTVEIEVDATGNDKVTVTGNAALQNTAVKISTLGSFVFDTPYQYLIVDGSLLIGMDNSVSIDNFLLDTDFANADMSSIVITKNPNALLNLAQTPNQKAMAVMAMTDTNDMVYLIFNNPNDAARLLNFTSGEIHASTQTSLTESTRHIREAVLSRMGDANNDGGIWAQVVGSWDNYDSNSTSKMKSETRGIIAGYDKDNGSRRTGISLGVTKTENKINDLNSSSDVNSTHLAIYTGSADYSKSYQTRFGAGISWHSVDSNRTIPISNENLQADYSARTYHLFGEIGKRQARSKGYLEPFLGIAYASTNSGGFSERSNNAAGGALAVDGKTHSSIYSNLGVRLLSKASGDKITLKASASWQHLLSGDTFKTSHRLLTGSTPFEIEGAPIAKDALVLDLGFDYHLSKNFSWGLSYNSQIAKQMHNNAIKLNFKWKY